MANYTLSIVAHVDRTEQANLLSCCVKADSVEWDDGKLGVTGNHAVALAMAYHNAHRGGQEWVVILEDDALPVVGFNEQLSAALDVAPSPIVSFYSGTGHPANYQARFAELSTRHDVCWILHQNMRHAVAYALHAEMFELGLRVAMTDAVIQRWAPDDALSKFARHHGISVASTNPSLVDHEDGHTVIKTRTSMGIPMITRRRPRKAHWCGTRMTWSDSAAYVDNARQT